MMFKPSSVIFSLLFVLGQFLFAQNEITILETLLKGKDLKRSLQLIDSMGRLARKKDPISALPFLDRTVQLGKDFGKDSVSAKALWSKSQIYRKKGEFDLAEKSLLQASELFKSYHNPDWNIAMHTEFATICMMKGVYDLALQKYLDAVKIAEKYNMKGQLPSLYANIGNIFIFQENYDKTIEFYSKAYDGFIVKGDTINAALTLDNLGLVHAKKKKFDVALQYHLKALKTIELLKSKNYLGECYVNIGNAYSGLNKYDQALEYLLKGKSIYEDQQTKYGLASVYINIGDIYLKQRKLKEALVELYKGYEISKEISSFELEKDYAFTLSQTYEEMGDQTNALSFFKISSSLKDSIFNKENAQQINELTEKFESKQKQTEIDLLTKDKQISEAKIKQNKITTYFLVIGILLTIVLLSTLFYRYSEKKKANQLLEEKNSAIHEQKKLIEEKQNEIIDSINYAKKLQGAILLTESDLKKHFDDIFILYKPKDIVSGDFYWFSESEDNKILAVADCTGHGVPGGFMSMLGYESLQDVALRKEISTTSQALTSLDKKITDSLNKSDRTFRDGMDITLIAINKRLNVLQYSGANRPLIQISKGELIEHKPDKQAIGGNIDNTEKTYTTHDIACEKGDLFYMFTDGYADQFGGPNEKKFKYKNLLAALNKNHPLPLSEQKTQLDNLFLDWKGKLEQLDDVCIIGIKI